MKCEYCNNIHDGLYGSGRFCSTKCARGFATSKNRKQINAKVSATMKSKYIRKPTKNELRDIKIKEILSNGFIFVHYDNIDFNNKYLINKQGRVFSLYTMKELKYTTSYDGRYKRVALYDTHKHKHTILVHRLVAENFIPNPNDLPLVNHKDENPFNNNANNLEWCDCSYNNTYNNVHKRRGVKAAETIRKKGGVWNKGRKMSQQQRQKISKSMKKYYENNHE